MSTLAIAALPVSPSTARDALGEPAEGDALFETAFGLVRLEALDDGIKLHLGLDFGEDPDRFGLAVRIALGDAVNGLEKVFVYPGVAKPSASTYRHCSPRSVTGASGRPSPAPTKPRRRWKTTTKKATRRISSARCKR
ncbi:MAG: hypothetical protein R3B99_08545 [Polyangiales bacterium]